MPQLPPRAAMRTPFTLIVRIRRGVRVVGNLIAAGLVRSRFSEADPAFHPLTPFFRKNFGEWIRCRNISNPLS